MKTPLYILMNLALLCTGQVAAQEAIAKPVTVAVLPFEASDEKQQGKAIEAATLLGAHLSANPNVWMVERVELDKILSEQTLKPTGMADTAPTDQVGKLAGAKALVTGRLIHTGDNVTLVVKVMSTATSRVFSETASAPTEASLEKLAAELASKVGKLLAANNTVFHPLVESYEDRIVRLRKLLKNKPLPSVQVSITEQHLRQVTMDPAVETEFKKVLIDLGYEIVDSKQPSRAADIVITGEAFSESGTRRGQLLSVRARVEVKAMRRSDSKVLAADRETTVAVDIAEAIAGKTALQEAGLTLVERLLSKIVGQ